MERRCGYIQPNRDKLITENMKLVYFLVNKYYPTFSKNEDIIQTGMIGLCKAADRWDSTKAKFSTFASKIILSEIKHEFRRNNRSVKTVSLDAMVGGEDEEKLSFIDVLPGDSDIDYDPTEEFGETLSAKDRELFEGLCNGHTQSDMARQMNVSTSLVGQRIRYIRKRWEENYGR